MAGEETSSFPSSVVHTLGLAAVLLHYYVGFTSGVVSTLGYAAVLLHFY